MEYEIITKLKSALAEPIKKECQVVYILAEARKLLDRVDKDKKILPILRFYSNWALHIEIDRTSAVHPLLEKIEQTTLNKQHDVGVVLKIIDFEVFREEMGLFLSKFTINNPFNNYDYWRDFRKLFVDILADCPLKPNYGGDMEEFRFIKSSKKTDVDFIIKFKTHTGIKGSFTFSDADEIIKKSN